MIARIEQDIAFVARTVVTDLAANGPGDFVTDVAARVPLEVICRMMGIPEDQVADVFRNSNVILGAQDPEYVPEGADIATALLTAGGELAELVAELARQRRENPADDLVTALALGRGRRRAADRQEIGSFFILLVGGRQRDHPQRHQPRPGRPDREPGPAGAVAGRLRRARPDRGRGDRALGEPGDVDAADRDRDVELAGQTVKGGDKLLLFYASANRDETVFADPDRFDVDRANPTRTSASAAPVRTSASARTWPGGRSPECSASCSPGCPTSATAAEPVRLRSSFINGIKHVPCEFTSPVG